MHRASSPAHRDVAARRRAILAAHRIHAVVVADDHAHERPAGGIVSDVDVVTTGETRADEPSAACFVAPATLAHAVRSWPSTVAHLLVATR